MKVFVSSTFEDLVQHRQAVNEAIRRLGMHTVDPAAEHANLRGILPTSLLALYLADVFLGIYASRYGELLENHSYSLTEKLYIEACENNLPRFIYLVDPHETWSHEFLQTQVDGARMRLFLDRIKQENANLRTFSTPQDLAQKVSFDLMRFRAESSMDAPFVRRHFLTGMLIIWLAILAAALVLGPVA